MNSRYLYSKKVDSALGAMVGLVAPVYSFVSHCKDVYSSIRRGDISSTHFYNSMGDTLCSFLASILFTTYFDTSYECFKRSGDQNFYHAWNFLQEYRIHGEEALANPFFPHPLYVTVEELNHMRNYLEEIMDLRRELHIQPPSLEQKNPDISERRRLIQQIDDLPVPPNIALLDSKEIATCKKTIESLEDMNDKNKLLSQLNEYESYLKSCCPISRQDVWELDPTQSITIHFNEAKNSIGCTYDEESLKEYIESCIKEDIEAKDIYRDIALVDKAITIYRGFDRRMMQFVNDVRAINSCLNVGVSNNVLTQEELRKARIAFYQKSGIYKIKPSEVCGKLTSAPSSRNLSV